MNGLSTPAEGATSVNDPALLLNRKLGPMFVNEKSKNPFLSKSAIPNPIPNNAMLVPEDMDTSVHCHPLGSSPSFLNKTFGAINVPKSFTI